MPKLAPDWTPPLKVIPQEFESAHGLMLRACDRNGLTSLNNFENATGLKMGHVFAGRNLDRLATVLELPVDAVADIAFQVQSTKPTLVRGETLRKFDIARKDRRVCPECMRENGYQRFWWDLLFITRCPTHGTELVGHCSCGGKLSWKDRELLRCRRCRTGSVIDTVATPISSPHPFEEWALQRLGVLESEEEVSLLQDMVLRDAIDLVTRVGRLHHAGWGKFWLDTSTSTGDLKQYRETGFAIIRDDGLLDLFDRVHQQSEKINGRPPNSMEASLGWFWSWFAHAGGGSLSHGLGELITRHFDNRFFIRQPGRLKSLQVGPRSLLGIRELSARTGKADAIVRSVLLANNMAVPSSSGTPMQISLEASKWVLETLPDTLEIKEAQAYLGVGWRSWIVLKERGWLPVHMDPVTYSARSSTTIPFILKRELQEWVEELAGGARPYKRCPDNCSTLSGPYRNKNVSFERLMDRVITKQVPVVGRLNSVTGLDGLIVRKTDIDDLVFRGGGRYCNRVLDET